MKITSRYPVESLLYWAQQKPEVKWLVQPVQGQTRTYTWAQAAAEVGRMAAALKVMGWPAGTAVAISGRNTAHWFFADLAIQWAGYVPVGIYPKQAASATTYILQHCEAKAVFLGPMPDGDDFLKSIPAGVMKISFPYPESPRGEKTWDELAQVQPPLKEYVRPAPDETMTLVYTSGTTGNPKGVVMSYGNLSFASVAITDNFPSRGDERLFSYLPLAHLMERAIIENASLLWGAEVNFLEALDKMATQLPAVAPTMFVAVPLVWTRFHSSITAKMPEARLRRLIRIPIVGKLLRRKLLKAIGLQNAWLCASGAAPLPKATIEFFREVLGIEILEAYGMTENCAYVSMGLHGQTRVGAVGKPWPDANFRLSPEGEIQVKHPANMKGYFKEPEKTRETFTEDGWLKTGDKGRLDADGYLYITGRVKDIFKTLKGKYVAPAPIEGALSQNTDIDQPCLVGMNLTQPIMVVTLTSEARRKNAGELEKQLLASMKEVNGKLEEHEKIAKLLVVKETWTIDNGFMTPTMKVKRNVVEERYAELIALHAKDREKAIAWQ